VAKHHDALFVWKCACAGGMSGPLLTIGRCLPLRACCVLVAWRVLARVQSSLADLASMTALVSEQEIWEVGSSTVRSMFTRLAG